MWKIKRCGEEKNIFRFSNDVDAGLIFIIAGRVWVSNLWRCWGYFSGSIGSPTTAFVLLIVCGLETFFNEIFQEKETGMVNMAKRFYDIKVGQCISQMDHSINKIDKIQFSSGCCWVSFYQIMENLFFCKKKFQLLPKTIKQITFNIK